MMRNQQVPLPQGQTNRTTPHYDYVIGLTN